MIPSRENTTTQQTQLPLDEPAPGRIPQQQLVSYLWGAAVLLRVLQPARDQPPT